VLIEENAAALAEPGLTELQNRMAGRLRVGPIRMHKFQAEEHGGALPSPSRSGWDPRSTSALLYALIH
jgi:hypothetical protein